MNVAVFRDRLDQAIKAKANAIGDNLQSVLEVWKNARDLWQFISTSSVDLSKLKPKSGDVSMTHLLLSSCWNMTVELPSNKIL